MDANIELISKLENWKILSSFIESFVQKCGCKRDFIYEFLLSCEEIFVNICSYAYDFREGNIKVKISSSSGKIRIIFSDKGLKFDPTKFENKNINDRIYDRKLGGLGIFLVKKIMNTIEYTRKNNKNILIMSKKMESDYNGR